MRRLAAAAVIIPALVLLALLAAPAARAQGRVELLYEYELNRSRYRFENPSTFNTPDVVPHEFTQIYWGDNQWAIVEATYQLAHRPWSSQFGLTPQRTTRGDDYDTFFQPDGDVVVSGTTGNLSLRSWRVKQTISLARVSGVAFSVGYQYRRDRASFHAGLKTVSHTRPPSVETTIVTTRESTISQLHEIQFGASRTWLAAGGWRIALSADVAPAAQARLTTILPDKYPGREIVFSAVVFSLAPRLVLSHGDKWPVSIALHYSKTFSYVSSRQFERHALGASLAVGWQR